MKLIHFLNVANQIVMILSAAILLVTGILLFVGGLAGQNVTYFVAGIALMMASIVPWLQRTKFLKSGENPLDVITGEEFKTDATQKGV